MVNRGQQSTHHYPAWCYVLAGALAPLSFLRIGEINITIFDIFILFLASIIIVKKKIRLLPKSIILLSTLFLFAISITLFRAPDVKAAVQQVLEWFFIFFLVVPVTYSFFRNKRSFYYVGLGLFLAILTITLYSAYELFIAPSGLGRYAAGRYGGTLFEDPQSLAFKLSTLTPFILLTIGSTCKISASRLFRFLLSGILIIVLVTAIFVSLKTLSRSGVISSLMGIIIFFIFTIGINNNNLIKRILKISFAIGSITGVMLLILKVYAPGYIIDRIDKTSYLNSPEITDRTDLYIEALFDINKSYYIVGVGPDNYQHISRYNQRVHNVILLMLVEGGVVVSACFVSLFVIFYKKVFLSMHVDNDRYTQKFLIAIFSSMSSYVMISMLNTQSIDRYYWFIFALGLSASRYLNTIEGNNLRSDDRVTDFSLYVKQMNKINITKI